MKSILGLAALALVAAHSAAQAQIDPTELSATQAAALIREGKLKSEDLVRALADAMEKKRDLNSFISFDREAALKAAGEADAAAAKKRFKGPLHGVPLVVKDNIHVRGFANTAGTPALKDFRPRRNAPVVRKLLDAGAIVLGKTNMHELASCG
jgi:mandelamide amidase